MFVGRGHDDDEDEEDDGEIGEPAALHPFSHVLLVDVGRESVEGARLFERFVELDEVEGGGEIIVLLKCFTLEFVALSRP